MEELLGSQQPEKTIVHAHLLALHLDPKQAVWVQAICYSRIIKV
jgi:hypothetical protein